ncbi:MAG: ABC-2 family transporter protein [Chloroflexota bacterium]
MKDHINLVYTFLRLGILNEFQYRANFFIQLLQTCLQLTVSIGGLAVVFQHTDNLGGWQAMELVALLGIYFVVRGAIYTVVSPSLELFMQDVRMGTLDYTLIKPVDAQFLVSIRRVSVWSSVDFFMGIVIIIYALIQLGTTIGVTHLLGFAITLLCGGIIVYSFWLVLATCAFWFIKVENILVIFESMYQAGKWPVTIYPQTLQILLTFIVPVAFAVTVPAQALVGQLTLQNLLVTIVVSMILFAGSRLFWMTGIKYYSGASA